MNNQTKNEAVNLILHKGKLPLRQSELLLEQMRGLVEAGQVPRAAFRIFVELVQNIRLHGGASGSVHVWTEDGLIHIEAANPASADDIRKVTDMIAYANAQVDELPRIIRTRRSKPVATESNGAGLGILEIRRLCPQDLKVFERELSSGNSELVIRASMPHTCHA